MKKTHSLYLVGSVRLWRKQFRKRYSDFFNKTIWLFEPGTLNVPDDHRRITKSVVARCAAEIRKSDAVLIYMKPYKAGTRGGPVGTDSSWECGFAYGIGKPSIALIDDITQLYYFEGQWMIPFNISAYLTTDKSLAERMKRTKQFKASDILVCESKKEIEKVIAQYLDAH